MKNHKFLSKNEIIDTLLKENPKLKDFKKLILIVEHKKISNELGIIKGELLENRKVIVRGSMTCLPQKSEEGFNWDMLSSGESYPQGYTFDYKEDSITSMVKQGLKKGLKEGKIPFFPLNK